MAEIVFSKMDEEFRDTKDGSRKYRVDVLYGTKTFDGTDYEKMMFPLKGVSNPYDLIERLQQVPHGATLNIEFDLADKNKPMTDFTVLRCPMGFAKDDNGNCIKTGQEAVVEAPNSPLSTSSPGGVGDSILIAAVMATTACMTMKGTKISTPEMYNEVVAMQYDKLSEILKSIKSVEVPIVDRVPTDPVIPDVPDVEGDGYQSGLPEGVDDDEELPF